MALNSYERRRRHASSDSLPLGVTMEAQAFVYPGGAHVILQCTGTLQALQSAGYLTAAMLARRVAGRSGKTQTDEHDQRFCLHRAPTKALQDRMRLIRYLSPELALALPGVSELFPDGMPKHDEPPVRPSSKESTEFYDHFKNASDWKRRVAEPSNVELNIRRAHWSGQGIYGPRFQFGQQDLARFDLIIEKFQRDLAAAIKDAKVIDAHQRNPLRLVVDNTNKSRSDP